MGFVQRAFTPPGTGGREAAAIQAQADAQAAIQAAQQQASKMPNAPEAPKPASAPPQFMAGAAPGAKQRSQITASTMLGAAATAGQSAKKSVLG